MDRFDITAALVRFFYTAIGPHRDSGLIQGLKSRLNEKETHKINRLNPENPLGLILGPEPEAFLRIGPV